MSISFNCPQCLTAYDVSDDKAGRTMRCKECETPISVPNGGDTLTRKSSSSRPKKKVAASSASKKNKSKASGVNENAVWIAGGVALVLVLVVIGFLLVGRSRVEPELAAEVPPVENAAAPAVAAAPLDPAAAPVEGPPGPVDNALAVADAVAAPPEDELLLLESITPEVLRNLMGSMAEERLQGTVAMRGRVQVHEEGRNLRSANMMIAEKVVREIGTGGEDKRSVWSFQQMQPAYQGGFVALNFAPGGDQQARSRTGDVLRMGNWVLNHPNGKPRVRGQYGNGNPALVKIDHTGQRDGIFVTMDADGRRIWQGKYVAGVLAESTYFTDEDEAFANVATFSGHQAIIRAMAFAGDGSTLATGDESGTVIVWNRNDQQKIATTLTGSRVLSLGFSPDGKLLAIGCQDNQLMLWRIDDNQQPQAVAVKRIPQQLKFSNDGRYLVSTAGIVEVASATSPTLFAVPGTYNGWYGYIKENPQAPPTFVSHFFPASAFDGERLVAATNTGIGTWNVAHDLSQSIGIEHKAKYRELMKSLFFLQGGRMVFVKKQEGGYGIYDTEQNVFQELNGPFVNTQIEFSADASRAINFNNRQPTRVFDGRTFELQCVLPTDNPRVLDYYHLSPNGRYAAIGRFKNDSKTNQQERTEVPVWDLHTARWFELKGHVAAIQAIEFSPDGRYLATSSEDLTCMLWDLESLSAVKGVVDAAANQPPRLQVSVQNAENLKQGDPLIASLAAEDPDGDELAFQYRFSDDKEWWPAWQGHLEFSPLPAGQLELQVRAIDPHGAEHVVRTPITVVGGVQ